MRILPSAPPALPGGFTPQRPDPVPALPAADAHDTPHPQASADGLTLLAFETPAAGDGGDA